MNYFEAYFRWRIQVLEDKHFANIRIHTYITGTLTPCLIHTQIFSMCQKPVDIQANNSFWIKKNDLNNSHAIGCVPEEYPESNNIWHT